MTKYSIATQNYLGSGPTIVAHVGEKEVPALIFSKLDKGFPFDGGAIARNFSALLNGQSDTEKVACEGEAIYYQGHPSAVTLAYQPEGQTMTRPGLMATINEGGLPQNIIDELKDVIDADFMKSLCDAVAIPLGHNPAPTTSHSRFNR